MLGIVGAMDEEVSKLKELMDDVSLMTKASMAFHKGKLFGKNVVVVRSGIGKVNAAICTQILVDEYGIDAVINTGIAGSLNASINIGDIVLSTDALYHDVNATGFGYEPGVIPRMDKSIFVADEALRRLAKECCIRVNPDISVFEGRVVSGDQFVSDFAQKEYIIKQFAGFCTEMEGAAIAQTAYLNHIPFLIIRAISDKADDSATEDYPTFEKKAILHSVNLMKEIIAQY